MLEKGEKVVVLDSNRSPDTWAQNSSLFAYVFEMWSQVRGLHFPARAGELTNTLKQICSFRIPGKFSFSNFHHKFQIPPFAQ